MKEGPDGISSRGNVVKLAAIRGNSQRLDGGAMFGHAPRALWAQWLEPDEDNRVSLQCRALLVEHQGRKILLETGIGSFFAPRLRSRYGVVEPNHVLLDSLQAHGIGHTDVDVVILSHLHFDHAGGLLAPFQEGREPELLFPNARFVVSRIAFERAQAPHLRDKASFIEELPDLLLGSGRLELVEAEQPQLDWLGHAFVFEQTHGHTPGMLHTTLRQNGQEVFFCADLVPGVAWVHLPITMGYDRNAELLVEEKRVVLQRLEQRRSWLFFTHDPAIAMARVARDERGRYRITAELSERDLASALGDETTSDT